MDKENVAQTCYILIHGIVVSCKEKEIMNFAGEWMDLKNVLGEVTQIQKLGK